MLPRSPNQVSNHSPLTSSNEEAFALTYPTIFDDASYDNANSDDEQPPLVSSMTPRPVCPLTENQAFDSNYSISSASKDAYHGHGPDNSFDEASSLIESRSSESSSKRSPKNLLDSPSEIHPTIFDDDNYDNANSDDEKPYSISPATPRSDNKAFKSNDFDTDAMKVSTYRFADPIVFKLADRDIAALSVLNSDCQLSFSTSEEYVDGYVADNELLKSESTNKKTEPSYKALNPESFIKIPAVIKISSDSENKMLMKGYIAGRSSSDSSSENSSDSSACRVIAAHYSTNAANEIATADGMLSKMDDTQLFDILLYALEHQSFLLIQKIIEMKPLLLVSRDRNSKTPLQIASDLNYNEAIDLCFKHNVFEKTDPTVLEMNSCEQIDEIVININKKLKNSAIKDVTLMIDTQNLLQALNSTTLSPEKKIDEVDRYKSKSHSLSTLKYALCTAAVIGIVLGVMLTCFVAGAVIGALATGWSGPGAGLGALWGAVSGLSYGWKIGIGIAGAAVGLGAGITVLTTNNFFSRTFERKALQDKAEKIADIAIAALTP